MTQQLRAATITIGLFGLLLAAPAAHARNLMTADGPGGTYELLQKAYSTELPDCGHMVPHITEEMDSELGKPVFIFHAHVNQDDDRCGASDRQRTEIRARAPDITANNGETVYYRWKFKLAAGFQGTPSFTHIFQIKSDQAAPVMTLTPRASTFAIDGRIGARGATDLAKFIGVWVVVELKVLYSNNGNLAMTIRRVSDGGMLFQYSGDADMWDDNASAHDSKFGIYRSLNNRGSLRDEQVRFADFCASKVSAAECADGATPPPSDAGAGPVDAGGSDATVVPPDSAAPSPDTGGAVQPDAAVTPPAPPPQSDAGSSPRPPPDMRRPDAAAPTSTGAPSQESSGCGCRVGGTSGTSSPGGGAVAGLCLLALALRRRWSRRKR